MVDGWWVRRLAAISVMCVCVGLGEPARGQEKAAPETPPAAAPAEPGPASPPADPVPAPVSPAPAPTIQDEVMSVQGFGDRHPECLSWSDSCVVCARGADDKPHCSTPGIACLPTATLCKAEKPK